MSVARCMEEVDAQEFAEWRAYESIEPFGGHVEDLRAGIVASTVAATAGQWVEPLKWFGWHEKKKKGYTLEDLKKLEKLTGVDMTPKGK